MATNELGFRCYCRDLNKKATSQPVKLIGGKHWRTSDSCTYHPLNKTRDSSFSTLISPLAWRTSSPWYNWTSSLANLCLKPSTRDRGQANFTFCDVSARLLGYSSDVRIGPNLPLSCQGKPLSLLATRRAAWQTRIRPAPPARGRAPPRLWHRICSLSEVR
jgi:hypothetical protein